MRIALIVRNNIAIVNIVFNSSPVDNIVRRCALIVRIVISGRNTAPIAVLVCNSAPIVNLVLKQDNTLCTKMR